MKIVCVLLLLVGIFGSLSAQTFAPLGARWGYQAVESDTSEVQVFFQVVEDTIIQNTVNT